MSEAPTGQFAPVAQKVAKMSRKQVKLALIKAKIIRPNGQLSQKYK